MLIVGWVVSELNDLRFTQAALGARVQVIEATQYTPEDALKLERAMNNRLESLHKEVNDLAGETKVIREIVERLEKTLSK